MILAGQYKRLMSSRFPINWVSAVLASISYVAFTTLAYIRYPSPYSPTANWLSDLGNTTVNVMGARFYNVGVILTGACLLVWFLGLSQWRIPGPSPQRWFLLAAAIAGSMGALALIISAVVPINMFEQHAFWSHAHFMMLTMGFGFSVASLRYHPRFPRPLLYLGTATVVSPLVLLALGDVYILEWVTIALFLAYVLSVGLSLRRVLRLG